MTAANDDASVLDLAIFVLKEHRDVYSQRVDDNVRALLNMRNKIDCDRAIKLLQSEMRRWNG